MITVTKTKEYTIQTNTEIAIYEKEDTGSLYLRHKNTGGYILIDDKSGGTDPIGAGTSTQGMIEQNDEYTIVIDPAPTIV